MWLINVHTLELEYFVDENAVKYVILSHRWEGDEVTFQKFHDKTRAREMIGFAKIERTCLQAVADGYDYAWVDSCCINKESSAELNEAINSIYRWYKTSAICYVFLSDYKINDVAQDPTKVPKKPKKPKKRLVWTDSSWFTRGWTLQELIAPPEVRFHDSEWKVIGSKRSFSSEIASRTRINEAIITGEARLASQTIAQRMSWAAMRTTTRVEDMAYCLLGIFAINMPTLYGEGAAAFIRLQEEIIRHSDDQSVFAWIEDTDGNHGMFASSPKGFSNCVDTIVKRAFSTRLPYSVTNRGLSMTVHATPWTVDTYLVGLDCSGTRLQKSATKDDNDEIYPSHDSYHARDVVFLRRSMMDDDQYARVRHEGQVLARMLAFPPEIYSRDLFATSRPIAIYVRQNSTHTEEDLVDRLNGFRLAQECLEQYFDLAGKYQLKVEAHKWDTTSGIVLMKNGDFENGVTLRFRGEDCMIKQIKLGFDFDFNPVCFVAMYDGNLVKTNQGWSKQYMERMSFHNVPVMMEVDNRPGLWALQGKRLSGLNVVLSQFQGGFAKYMLPQSVKRDTTIVQAPCAAIKIRRGIFEDKLDKLVWVVTFAEISKEAVSVVNDRYVLSSRGRSFHNELFSL